MTASLLPNGVLQFVDINGAPLVGGTVTFYIPTTTTPKDTWQDAGQSILNENPLPLDERGQCVVWGTGSYRQIIKDIDGNLIWDKVAALPSLESINAMARDFSNRTDDLPSTAVEFIAAGAGATARTGQDKLRDVVSIKDFGAMNNTESTAAIQAAIVAATGVYVPDGVYLISSEIALDTDTFIFGPGTIKAANGANILGSMLSGTSITGATVEGITLDANADNTGCRYGVTFSLSSEIVVRSTKIRNTKAAGIVFAQSSQCSAENNRLSDIGRAGDTDAHGIMAYSNTGTPLTDINISDNVINTVRRKGITTYSDLTGSVENVAITGNTVTNCGVAAADGGGIYCANAPTAANPQSNITVTGNVLADNYVNILLGGVSGASVQGNSAATSMSEGLQLTDCSGVTATGNVIKSSAVRGMFADGCSDIMFSDNLVAESNAGGTTGAGILLNDTTDSIVAMNRIPDADVKQGYGVVESGTSDRNAILDNKISGVVSAPILSIGVNTAVRTILGAFTGFGKLVPAATVDIDGTVIETPQALPLVNGSNNNVALPTKATVLYVTGPTGVFTITGIAGGSDGRRITIINYTAFAMTLAYSSGSSSVGNKLIMQGAANVVVPQFGTVSLTYLAAAQAWAVED